MLMWEDVLRSVFGKMGAWEKAVQVLTIMRSEVRIPCSYPFSSHPWRSFYHADLLVCRALPQNSLHNCLDTHRN